jgi:membrane-bound serine protease (ClpP class)
VRYSGLEVSTTVSTRGEQGIARGGRTRGLSVALLALGALLMFAGAARGAGPEVVVLPTTGTVDEGMVKYLADNIDVAAQRGAAAVVIKLNTPGGSIASMQKITATILESPVPVIVWVAPAGGMAASAGTFITLSANVALMAPATIIGAASPVSGNGEDIPETERRKIFEAVSNLAQSLAERRDRPVDWAVSTVMDAAAYTANEAVEAGAVDGIAATIEEVIAFADGRTVEVGGADVTLELSGATTTEQSMNPLLSLIRLISDPNIAFLLFSLGSTGLLIELYAPNFVTGILGALALLLGLMGLGTLPLNVGGFLLVVFGLVLFGLELTVTSHGLLGFGGLVCFALGASALFTGPSDPFQPVVQVAPVVIVIITATAATFLGLIIFGAIRSRRIGAAMPIGASVKPGAMGEVRAPLRPSGSVFAGGEEWTAMTADGRALDRGTPVRITKVDGLTLTVEPDASSSKGT